MPPLDTGSTAHTLRLVDPLNDRAAPALGEHPTVGAYLRAVRESRGASVGELAAATRIRGAYLAAIEQGEYDTLPSRPFAIGYVRAYAAALEVDGDAAAERYKVEAPDTSEPLRAPVGVKHERAERTPLLFAAAAVLIAAVVGWNLVQRALSHDKDPASPPVAPAVAEEAAPTPSGPIALGAPTPPPAEQTTPIPYATPGLPAAVPNASATTAPAAPAAPAPVAAAAPVFTPKGTTYGAAAAESGVVLQARKPASLIVRGPGGEVYFARQLAEGESYRAPVGQKLSADVTDPTAFSVYVEGQLHGGLTTPQTALDKLGGGEAPRTASSKPAVDTPPRPAAAKPAVVEPAPAPVPTPAE